MQSEIRNITAKLRSLKYRNDKIISGITFTYYEQELIRRIIKSVLPQVKNISDRDTIKSILEKTEWLD